MIEAVSADTKSTTADRPRSFEDAMVELGIGAELLIDRLEKAFDAGFELDMDVSGDVMDAIIAAQWIAQRLSDDISRVGYEFDGSRSDRGSEFAQAAE
jgi:hypothetical protein